VSGQRSCQEASPCYARVKSGQRRCVAGRSGGGRLAHSLHAHPLTDGNIFHGIPLRRRRRRLPGTRSEDTNGATHAIAPFRTAQRQRRGRPSNWSCSPRSRGRWTVIVRQLGASRRRWPEPWREPTDPVTAMRRRRAADRRKDWASREASESESSPTPVRALSNASIPAETDSPLLFRQLADLSDDLGSLGPHEKSRLKTKCHSDGPS